MLKSLDKAVLLDIMSVLYNDTQNTDKEKRMLVMSRTTYSKEHTAGVSVTMMPDKTIVLPFDETMYTDLIVDKAAYTAYLNERIQAHPELFPSAISEGWSLHGFTRPSAWYRNLRCRRVLTRADGEVWLIRPSFVMPYMTCDTATAEKILFLAKWAPNQALAHAFDKNERLIDRLHAHLGRYSLAGTTVKKAEALPRDLAADEKHTTLAGERVYLLTTVGEHCFLGVGVSPTAGEADLTQAYRQFQDEAQQIADDYQPSTVNTDGWAATINTWKMLFPTICVIKCFLHAVLSIRRVATNATKALYQQIAEKTWDAYHAAAKRSFSQRIRRLREWGWTLTDGPLKQKLLKLCEKRDWFRPAYDFANALRTSNMVDRLMQGMEKYLFAKQYFHGTPAAASDRIRAYCQLTNFRPYNPTTRIRLHALETPFERLNGFTYHDSWLQNLLISTSTQSIYRFQHKPTE